MARKKIAEAQKRRWQKIRGTSNRPPRGPQTPRVAKSPPSPLHEKLVKNIGRELQDDEARFVCQVQRCFADARVRMFTENDLGLMAGRATLGTANGSSPPKILCALDGRPTLYLTEGGLFVGPPAALDAELRKNIPAPGLETAAGMEFLHAAGIALP